MSVRVFLDQQELIEMLNTVPLTLAKLDSLVMRYVEKSGKISRGEAKTLWKAEVSRWLRYRIDEWLTTGLNPDGSESPCNRSLVRTADAKRAVMRYAAEHPPHFSFSAEFAAPELVIGAPHRFSRKWNEFFLEAVKEADRYFTSFMAAEWKDSLCQCRFERCSRYFLAKIKSSRKSFRHGTFCCREHQNLASAAICTKQRRARAENELVNTAARHLIGWRVNGPGWQSATILKHRLAACLCRYVDRKRFQSYRQKVGVNWVTRHQVEIEERRGRFLAHQSGILGSNQGTPRENAPEVAKRTLNWIVKQTPDLMHFIHVLSTD